MNQKTKDIIYELLTEDEESSPLSQEEKEMYLKLLDLMYSKKEITDIRDSLESPETIGRNVNNE